MKRRRIFISIIILTLIFIWGQSCLSREQSSAESETVKSWLELIFRKETPLSLFIIKYIRKIAHFLEFGLLGTELAFFTAYCTANNMKSRIYCGFFGPVVATIDETIQIFTGRGSSFYDILLDGAGYFSFVLVSVALLIIIKKLKKGNTKNV